MFRLLVVIASSAALLQSLMAANPPGRWWADDVERALASAGANRSELEKALAETPADQRPGMAFLIANMPDGDLRSLKAEFLLTNAKLAYKARAETPWGKKVPDELFLNDVLPYANLDEKRDAWRQEFYDLCLPLVKDCKTPTDAVQRLNAQLFKKLKLGYSTQRRAPNQGPAESIELGKASCTGLSVVLSDACRALAIPARLVGTPLWSNNRGNHTWVEVWDDGWHFTGACEPDPQGLDRGWFVGDASHAQKDSFEHAIYAASFKKTGLHFPLVWAPKDRSVPAVNITDRYARPAVKTDVVRVRIRVLDASKARLATTVTATPIGSKKEEQSGKSRDEKADLNDVLTFELPPEKEYVIAALDVAKTIKTGPAGKEITVEIIVPKEKK